MHVVLIKADALGRYLRPGSIRTLWLKLPQFLLACPAPRRNLVGSHRGAVMAK